MPTLNQIAGSLSTATVKLSSGATLAVTALTEQDVSAIHRMIPRPIPPMGKDPTKGSAAPHVLKEDDPKYQASLRSWVDRIRRLEAAIAGSLSTADGQAWHDVKGDEGRAAAWAQNIDEEILASRITRFDLMAITEAAAKCAGARFDDDAIMEAEGN